MEYAKNQSRGTYTQYAYRQKLISKKIDVTAGNVAEINSNSFIGPWLVLEISSLRSRIPPRKW